MALSRLSIKIYQLFRISSFLIYLSLSTRLILLSLFLNHKYFHLDINNVISKTYLSINIVELLISVFVFHLKNLNAFKIIRLIISSYTSMMIIADVTDIKVFKNWYYYAMLLSYCIWQMYDNFNSIFKQRIHKSFIKKYFIRSFIIPVYIISQLIVVCLNYLYLSKLTLLGVDQYYYYLTGSIAIIYIPAIVYISKKTI